MIRAEIRSKPEQRCKQQAKIFRNSGKEGIVQKLTEEIEKVLHGSI